MSDEVKQKGKDEEEEDEIYDEVEDKQEGEAAVKLSVWTLSTPKTQLIWFRASIFTKNQKSVPVADKGWKDGEASVRSFIA